MISQTFIAEYLKLFFPNHEESYSDLREMINDFTDPYIEASNMAVLALDQNKKIVLVNQLTASLFGKSEIALLDQDVASALPLCPLSKVSMDNFASLPKDFSLAGKQVHAERTPIVHNDKVIAVISFLYELTDSGLMDQRSIETQKNVQFLNDIIDNSYDPETAAVLDSLLSIRELIFASAGFKVYYRLPAAVCFFDYIVCFKA